MQYFIIALNGLRASLPRFHFHPEHLCALPALSALPALLIGFPSQADAFTGAGCQPGCAVTPAGHCLSTYPEFLSEPPAVSIQVLLTPVGILWGPGYTDLRLVWF